MESDSGYKIIVGVDYGCTSTGIAYVLTGYGKTGSVESIRIWPPHTDDDKAPSLISYTQDDGPPLWGFQVKSGMQAFAWTKLLLDRSLDHRSFNDEILEKVTASGILKLPNGKGAVDVVADFLSQIHAHIIQTIGQFAFVDLKFVPVDFWFTIPASWSEEAQCLMRHAIKMAGIGSSPLHQVRSTTEPEAAVLAVFHDGRFNLEAGEGVLVCDCGGGTVDIATYYVTDTGPTPYFEQITTAVGAKCGATAIDSRFYQLMSIKLDRAFNSLLPSSIRPGSTLMNRFEEAKHTFNGEGEKTWNLPLNIDGTKADPTFFDRRRRCIILRSQDLRDLFDPVLNKIFTLIASQITAANDKFQRQVINKVVLVGGFSTSPYLQNKLRYALKQNRNISVCIPNNPRKVVAHGAALHGLLGYSFPTYKCWRHYGLASAQPFVFAHQTNSQALSDELSVSSVKWSLHWVLHKDQRYPKDFQTSQRIQLHHMQHELPIKLVGIHECSLPVPPDQLDHLDPKASPIDYIQCDFNGIDLAQFPHQTIGGQTVYHLDVLIQVSLVALGRMIQFSVYTLGKEIGRKELAMAND